MADETRTPSSSESREMHDATIRRCKVDNLLAHQIDRNLHAVRTQRYEVPAPSIETDLAIQAHVLCQATLKQMQEVNGNKDRWQATKITHERLQRLYDLTASLKDLDARFWKTALKLEMEFDRTLVEPKGGRAQVHADREKKNREKLKEIRPLRDMFEEMSLKR